MLQQSPEYILHELNKEMANLYGRDNAQSRSMSAYLRRLTVTHRLAIEEFELLHEAYERAVLLISKGKVSHATNLVAYLKRIASNIAKEERRKTPFHHPINEESCTKDSLSDININSELDQLAEAMTRLDEPDRRLLTLKIIDNKSWKEIHQLWCKETQEKASISCLRKRKERALSKLRHLYHRNTPETLTLQGPWGS